VATGAVRIEGLRELDRAFAQVSKQTQKEFRSELKKVGEPVRSSAEELAVSQIANIGGQWSRMRLGSTARVVYVQPRTRRRDGSPRPNLAGLLMAQALLPALHSHEDSIEAGVERWLDSIIMRNGFA
jgi:hypothetical protein